MKNANDMKYNDCNAPKPSIFHHILALCVTVSLAFSSTGSFAAMDNETANAFLKTNDCTKCHSVKKTKKGPSYKKIAAKHKSESDAMDKLYKQVTTGPTVKLEDGSEEEHPILKSDPQEIRDLLQWILAL
ncbi:MAG TPA: c-type cytochrome [Gammaproteobacteria bacterium]